MTQLLSTLRLVTQADQSSCSKIGNDMEVMEGIVKVARISIVPALNIEASRLLSSVVRYSKESSVIGVCVACEAVPLFVGLLNSPHTQLLNEMLIVLNLVVASQAPSAKLVEEIDPEFMTKKLIDIIKMDECQNEIKSNALTLAYNMLRLNAPEIKDLFINSDFKEVILGLNFASEVVKNLVTYL